MQEISRWDIGNTEDGMKCWGKTKDMRNCEMWQSKCKEMRNVEVLRWDERNAEVRQRDVGMRQRRCWDERKEMLRWEMLGNYIGNAKTKEVLRWSNEMLEMR